MMPNPGLTMTLAPAGQTISVLFRMTPLFDLTAILEDFATYWQTVPGQVCYITLTEGQLALKTIRIQRPDTLLSQVLDLINDYPTYADDWEGDQGADHVGP